MSFRGISLCFIGIIFLLTLSITAQSAAYDWGTKGVSDTSKVTNIVQLTSDEAAGQNFLMTGGCPDCNGSNVQPWSKDGQWIAFTSQVDGTNDTSQEIAKIKPDGSSFTRLTNNSVDDSTASFSSGNTIFYGISTGSPNYYMQIWRMNDDGSGQTQLTGNNDQSVVVSPDGTMIAYYVSGLLWVADANGTSPVRVSGTYNAGVNNINVLEGQYSWSPDSQWIAYTGSNSDGYWIYKVKPDGSSHTQLTSRGSDLASIYHYWPSWSPDGTKISYLWKQYTGTIIVPNYIYYLELRTIDPTGTALKTLDTATDDYNIGSNKIQEAPATWSPDSMWVAYHKSYTGAGAPADPSYSGIYIVNVEDAVPSPNQLTTGYYDYFPIWAPTGTQLVFQSGRYQISREDETGGTDPGDILIVNLKGNYGGAKPFPWHMFLPAIQSANK